MADTQPKGRAVQGACRYEAKTQTKASKYEERHTCCDQVDKKKVGERYWWSEFKEHATGGKVLLGLVEHVFNMVTWNSRADCGLNYRAVEKLNFSIRR